MLTIYAGVSVEASYQRYHYLISTFSVLSLLAPLLTFSLKPLFLLLLLLLLLLFIIIVMMMMMMCFHGLLHCQWVSCAICLEPLAWDGQNFSRCTIPNRTANCSMLSILCFFTLSNARESLLPRHQFQSGSFLS